MTHFSWMPFYRELSIKLLQFRNERDRLIEIVLNAYKLSKINMPKMDSTVRPTDMDPFTVFGMFNKQMKEANRIALCLALKELLVLGSDAPSDFDGIPVLNPLNATFYCFTGDSARSEHDVDALWDCFAAAIRYADIGDSDSEKAFIDAYDAAKDLKGNRWKLSMGLFWVRPDTFLNLDSRNQWFLMEMNALGNAFAEKLKTLDGVPDGMTYIEICKDCIRSIRESSKYASISELSNDAWNTSEDKNRERRQNAVNTPDLDRTVRQTHYWLYAPGPNAEYWDPFCQDGIIALGWGESGDLRNLSNREAIKNKLRNEWASPESPVTHPSLALWQF